MQSLNQSVYDLLSGLSCPVFYHYPQADAALPCACFYEAENRAHAQADGMEWLSELEYAVDIFARAPEDACALAISADALLAPAGFRRTSSQDLYDAESRAHRRHMRYRALLTANGDKFQ